MVKGFYEDLAHAKKAEGIVLDILRNCTDEYDFVDVSNDEYYWHKGDIIIDDNIFLDVKDDGVIHRTGNLLAEHRVKYGSTWAEGFMQNAEYDFVGYLSQPDNILYILDFNLWKKYYLKRSQKHIFIPHVGQTTDAYLMSLKRAKELGIVLFTIKYAEEDGHYMPVEIVENKGLA